MRVEQLMVRDVKTVEAQDTLHNAARIMWEQDCGCVPVVDEQRRVIGIVTDRDVCLAAFAQSKPLTRLRVSDSMARRVYTCRPDDSIAYVETLMQQKQVRRLPVVGADERLVGIVSLHDLACEAHRELSSSFKEVRTDEVGATLGAVSAPVSHLGQRPLIH